ncbi:imidazole glycerol phosphate synthase [Ectobacillus sp. JY-23]|uniref:imidazole glycerol phosphate synthase n=1 Tax=Ectobacillus sp. JY-23 TaxID=2933872 RepID=UPI001FF2B710|nr:imidazole glycerol phosphate synthase [Ectobacillus sp. JY-23]UOY93273.1 imidazole glycerol phosphate synthase [Ectobacillus sp. JY-23]
MADRDYERLRDHTDEEYAAEVAPARIKHTAAEPTSGGAIFGFIALALGILSFFTFPVFFGIAAVLIGLYAASKGARTTGRIAIILGAVAAVMALVFRVAVLSFLLSLF